jgi:hypothetical protein
MDGMPLELIKLCGLASLAECGDDVLEGVPALGLWGALCMPVRRRWKGWREARLDIFRDVPTERLLPII